MDQDEPLNQWVAFAGTLSRDGESTPIRLRLRVMPTGELKFRVNRLPMTRETLRLGDLRADNRKLTLEAKSVNGTLFRTDNLIVTSRSTPSTPKTVSLALGVDYSSGRFSRIVEEVRETPIVRFDLRGFEAFPGLRVECPLGAVFMHGKYPAPKSLDVSGVMWVTAKSAPEDMGGWRAEVDRLSEHVLDLISFALSHQVRSPLKTSWTGADWELMAYNQTYGRRNAQHVLHPMQLQPFLEAAVGAFFNPPVPVKNLAYALEWFAMRTTYSEMRLTNVMTALENLVDSNLGEAEKFFLPPKVFKRASSGLREAILQALAAAIAEAGGEGQPALEELGEALRGKLQDLNRRSLFDKLMRLANRWGVPLHDLPVADIKAAINARNSIVHRGYYYEPKAGSREQADLWSHVLMMREVAIRFVFTVIGYQGRYLSFRGGPQDVTFPPEVSGI